MVKQPKNEQCPPNLSSFFHSTRLTPITDTFVGWRTGSHLLLHSSSNVHFLAFLFSVTGRPPHPQVLSMILVLRSFLNIPSCTCENFSQPLPCNLFMLGVPDSKAFIYIPLQPGYFPRISDIVCLLSLPDPHEYPPWLGHMPLPHLCLTKWDFLHHLSVSSWNPSYLPISMLANGHAPFWLYSATPSPRFNSVIPVLLLELKLTPFPQEPFLTQV